MKRLLLLAAVATALLIASAAQANPVSGSLYVSPGSPTGIFAQFSIPKNDFPVITVTCADYVASQTTPPLADGLPSLSPGIQFRQVWQSSWDTPAGESCTASLSYTGAKGTVVLDTIQFAT